MSVGFYAYPVCVQVVVLMCCVPDIRLYAAVPGQLVFSEVGVMRRGNEVMGQGPGHILVDPCMVRVKHSILVGQHVHGETIRCHEVVLLSCTGQNTQTLQKAENKTGFNLYATFE